MDQAANAFGLSLHAFLEEAGINQQTITGIRKRHKAGENVQGFTFIIFLKLLDKYPELNIGAFFDINQPIKISKGQGVVDSQATSTIQKLQHRIEILEIDNQHLKDKLKLTEELLDACREKIKP